MIIKMIKKHRQSGVETITDWLTELLDLGLEGRVLPARIAHVVARLFVCISRLINLLGS